MNLLIIVLHFNGNTFSIILKELQESLYKKLIDFILINNMIQFFSYLI